MTSNQIDELTFEDFELVYQGLRAGIYGPVADTRRQYELLAAFHNLMSTNVSIGSQGKVKPPKMFTVAEYNPVIHQMAHLGKQVERKDVNQQILAAVGMPTWMKEKIKQAEQDGEK